MRRAEEQKARRLKATSKRLARPLPLRDAQEDGTSATPTCSHQTAVECSTAQSGMDADPTPELGVNPDSSTDVCSINQIESPTTSFGRVLPYVRAIPVEAPIPGVAISLQRPIRFAPNAQEWATLPLTSSSSRPPPMPPPPLPPSQPSPQPTSTSAPRLANPSPYPNPTPASAPRLARSEDEEQELRLARCDEKQVHGSAELSSTYVTAILKHHVYHGALPGCLFNVYAKLGFSNGNTYVV